MKKILTISGIILIVIILALTAIVSFTWNKVYDAPYPDITATTDSTLIAHGKHLVYGAAHCSTCHTPQNRLKDIEAGEDVPLSGGWEIDIPPGTFRAPNLTPHPENGIGRLTDQEIARVMRHAVGDDGRVIFPFMPFQNMSDEDVTAIISYLRSQEPINNPVEKTNYSTIGKIVLSLGLIKPEGPTDTPPVSVKKDSTIEYGSYLANSVANCAGCHTNRSLVSGEFIGPRYAGGMTMEDEAGEGYWFVTPNITPHKETGVMTNWSEKNFIDRFRAGRIIPNSTMPWGSFAQMDDVELKAIYRYLNSIEPIENSVPKTVYAPGEELPDE